MNTWHHWFAWFPVFIDGEDGELYFVWLEDVVRRRVYIRDRYRWQYQLHKGSSLP